MATAAGRNRLSDTMHLHASGDRIDILAGCRASSLLAHSTHARIKRHHHGRAEVLGWHRASNCGFCLCGQWQCGRYQISGTDGARDVAAVRYTAPQGLFGNLRHTADSAAREGAHVIINNCYFNNISTAGAGGVLYASAGSSVDVANSMSQYTSAAAGGFATVVGESSMSITRSLHQYSTATGGRGGLLAVGSAVSDTGVVDISNSEIAFCSAVGNGGALALYNSLADPSGLLNVYMHDNTAAGNGGAIAVGQGDMAMTSCRLFNNTATGLGGAAYVTGATTTITDYESQWYRNTAPALQVDTGAQFAAYGSVIGWNGLSATATATTTSYPGAINCINANLDVSQSIVAGSATATGALIPNIACSACSGCAQCGQCPTCGLCTAGGCNVTYLTAQCATASGSAMAACPAHRIAVWPVPQRRLRPRAAREPAAAAAAAAVCCDWHCGGRRCGGGGCACAAGGVCAGAWPALRRPRTARRSCGSR